MGLQFDEAYSLWLNLKKIIKKIIKVLCDLCTTSSFEIRFNLHRVGLNFKVVRNDPVSLSFKELNIMRCL